MAVFVDRCPHCSAENATFHVFGARPHREQGFNPHGHNESVIAATCGVCQGPICARATETVAGRSFSSFRERVLSLVSSLATVEELNFVLWDFHPADTGGRVPDHLPPAVEKSLLQAEKNFASEHCEDAAAIMYRRALEAALKDRYPEQKGTLAARIDKAVANGELPRSIGEWAHEVRLVGNEAAHDEEGVQRVDLADARNFVDAILRYLFSLPGMVAQRRERREDADFVG